MRQSSRLKGSETSLKLKNEEFLAEVAAETDDEYVEESELVEETFDSEESEEKEPASPKKLKKRGRPRKNAPKPEIVENETLQKSTIENSKLAVNEVIPKKRGRPKKNDPRPPTPTIKKASSLPRTTKTKKKINRNGPYVPPLEIVNYNLFSSLEEWKSFFEVENPKIKRKNRRFKTVMFPSIENFNVEVMMSSFRNSNQKHVKRPLEISVNSNSISLLDEALIIEGKIANYNVGNPIISINFCKCAECKRGADKIFIYAVSSERISVISAEISKKEGIKSMKEIGQILPPESETFKTVCVFESILSASTENSIYFLNSESLHQEESVIILEKGRQIITESIISCHSWKGKNIVVGTLSGRVHVFNHLLEEIFQISVKSDSAIYSLDWRDDFTILIGGNFSKIFSIDLRDPFIIETEVSTLATLPKVIWSQSLNSILFSDSENHVRRLDSNNFSRFHHPFGTFDSMVNDMKTSFCHNITASACASGSIHLAWMSDEAGHAVEYEKRIFSLKMTEIGSYELILDPEYVPFQVNDVIKLYPSLVSCTSVDWCPNENFPGLLAGGYRNGLIVLVTTDRFFI